MRVKNESEVAQSCLTLSDPMDYSLPGSSIHGISRQEYWSGVPLPSPMITVGAPIAPRSSFLPASCPVPRAYTAPATKGGASSVSATLTLAVAS